MGIRATGCRYPNNRTNNRINNRTALQLPVVLLVYEIIYGGKRVTGVPRGLQHRCVGRPLTDEFDSHLPPPKIESLLVL